MSKSLLNLLVAASLFVAAHAFADGTNSIPVFANTDAVNAFLQIQAQLHETQMSVESNRAETAAVLQHNADALATDIQLLQQNIANQRVNEANSAQTATDSIRKLQQTLLLVAGIGMLALLLVVIMVFLQLRAATRLIELAMAPSALNNTQRAMPVVETAAVLPPSARAALEFSNARLLGVIERLEKRILELEHTAHAPLAESNGNGNGNGHGAIKIEETPDERRLNDLIVEGQLFLDTNKADKALTCFDAALEAQPDMAEALIKKAAALEKLERMDDAIACYDRAIEAEDSATTALLQKGGLLNRLARYEEALQCYERALRTQEKKAASV
jgi:tetratricopeptide (TPR) repeat protein